MSVTFPLAPCPTFDRLADAAHGGQRDALARLNAHVDACPACLSVATAADEWDAGTAAALASLGTVACPPGVVEAALRQARHAPAPDRPAHAGRRVTPRRRLAVGIAACACAALVALVATGRFAPPSDRAAPVADAAPAPESEPAAVDLAAVAPSETVPVPDALPSSASPSPTPATEPALPVRSTPPSRPAVRPEPLSPAPLVAALPTAPATAADTAAAVSGARLALALVVRARQDAIDAVAPELQRPQETLASTHIL